MFGHGCPLGEPDFWPGALSLVDGDLVADAMLGAAVSCASAGDVLVVPAESVVEVLCVLGAAAAPAMPAAAPPAASAPATMVAPRSLEMVMLGVNLLGRVGVCRASCAPSLSVYPGGA